MFQQSVLPRDRAIVFRMKDMKVTTKDQTKGTKLGEENGRKPKISLNYQTNRTDVLPVLVITTPMIVLQDINLRQPPLVAMLMAQVFTVIHQS